VADHIPSLFDAVVDLLGRHAEPAEDAPPPLSDPDVAAAATRHSQARFEQGLGAPDVVTEFRILRQEIARSLTGLLDDGTPPVVVVGGVAGVAVAFGGAGTVGLASGSVGLEGLRETFLATTLHDIRQPVTLIEGSLHLADRWLSDPASDPGKVRDAVGDALSATTELVAIIDTLSDATRVAVGALEPELEPASLEAIVRQAIAVFGAAARERVVLTVPSGNHLIGLWDPGLIHRLVANLVGNALKYSPVDRPVRVSIEPGDDHHARLLVEDEGLGMSAEELATVFDRFSRADRVRQQGIPGLGLGLYACRGIVLAHGGTIDLRSAGHDRGTTVEIALPLMDEAAGED
jgi:signal transduction histidine kinase